MCHEALRIRRHVRGVTRHHAAAELASLDATWRCVQWQGPGESAKFTSPKKNGDIMNLQKYTYIYV